MKKIIINGLLEEKTCDNSSHNKEIGELNQLFLEEDCENGEKIKRNIVSKLRSYKNQDLKKDRYNDEIFISYDQIIEKLIVSKLKCYYCKNNVQLLYSVKRDKNQWSLDRIDNSICHTNKNTVISCLHCNLQKRCRDKDKFKFTKQMRIKKQN